tara:strand:- start:271 stop:1302 length:1032 start_codon:yes stop_codon:yes gene_type:complete
MSIVNWGIIGLGNIANKFASAFAKVKNSKLISVASLNNERLEDFKIKFNLDKNFCYDQYEKLLLNDSVDIIYIALPHAFHFEWIIKCINNKKNILTEKPATINSKEIDLINSSLDKTKLFFAEGFMYRFHPQTAELVNILRQNEIGELLKMNSYFGVNIIEKKSIFGLLKRLKIKKKNRLFKKELGGGSILDLGCYPSSLSILIARLKSEDYKNKIILSDINKIIGPTDVDLEAYLKIKFGNGFSSEIGSSFKKNLGKSTTIFGSKGKIIIPDSWHCDTSNFSVNGKIYNVKKKYENIFSYEIESISNSLLNGDIVPKYPAINRKETGLNMDILTRWINSDGK